MEPILTELYNFSAVYDLGLLLGTHMSTMKKIRADNPSTRKRQIRVIYTWLTGRAIMSEWQEKHLTWGVLANALDMISLSLAIGIQYLSLTSNVVEHTCTYYFKQKF